MEQEGELKTLLTLSKTNVTPDLALSFHIGPSSMIVRGSTVVWNQVVNPA